MIWIPNYHGTGHPNCKLFNNQTNPNDLNSKLVCHSDLHSVHCTMICTWGQVDFNTSVRFVFFSKIVEHKRATFFEVWLCQGISFLRKPVDGYLEFTTYFRQLFGKTLNTNFNFGDNREKITKQWKFWSVKKWQLFSEMGYFHIFGD